MFRRRSTGRWSCSTYARTTNGSAVTHPAPSTSRWVRSRIDEIDADAKLFVVCQAGGRSQRVAQYLARNGYAPVNVSGGMLAWAGAGRPVVTDDGGTGAI
jgi:rhodanese-related sulfurtransferase